jgi:hypothetical protein
MKSYGIGTPAYTPPVNANQRKLPATCGRGPEPGDAFYLHFTCILPAFYLCILPVDRKERTL